MKKTDWMQMECIVLDRDLTSFHYFASKLGYTVRAMALNQHLNEAILNISFSYSAFTVVV